MNSNQNISKFWNIAYGYDSDIRINQNIRINVPKPPQIFQIFSAKIIFWSSL